MHNSLFTIKKESGNFLLQALFALAIVIVFLPVMVRKIETRNFMRENIAIAGQITLMFSPTRSYIYDTIDNFPDGVRVFTGDELVRILEPHGLPLGFIPITPRGGRLSLVISKEGPNVLAVVSASGVDVTGIRKAEILARIGFWAAIQEYGILQGATGGWFLEHTPNNVMFNPNDILMRVPDEDEFSELVHRRTRNPERNAFHTSLGMEDNNISGVRGLTAATGRIRQVTAREFMLSGADIDRRTRNEIGNIRTDRLSFSSSDNNPLTITRGDLRVRQLTAGSVGAFGAPPNLAVVGLEGGDFSMAAGRTTFAGPSRWDIRTSANFINITLNVERLTLSSFLDASRGQDVFLDDFDGVPQAPSGVGIRTAIIRTNSIVLRDQISSDLLSGGQGLAILEIRPSDVSRLPDVLLATINNDSLRIPISPEDNEGRMETCRAIISRTNMRYHNNSLANNIICQFVMYNRIERRLDILQCLQDGRDRCL